MEPYRPENLYQRLLVMLEPLDNRIGYSARRKLMRRYKRRAEVDWKRVVSTLRPGDIALDLGANLGEVTRELAATGAEVHAFEPDPATFERLQANAGDLPNVTLHQKAVAAEGGTLRLSRDRKWVNDPVKYSATASIMADPERLDADLGVDVEVVGFADLLAGFERPVKLVKMDIEGAELDILRQLRARPELMTFEALYAETHQHLWPEHMPEIFRMREWAASFETPEINLFWR